MSLPRSGGCRGKKDAHSRRFANVHFQGVFTIDLSVKLTDRSIAQHARDRAAAPVTAQHRGAEPPLIHVSARPVGREWLFSVRDNGAGIEPRAHRDVFHALSGARELPGCRSIVRRHGGRIWVESARGHGATFYFTLPATRRLGHVS